VISTRLNYYTYTTPNIIVDICFVLYYTVPTKRSVIAIINCVFFSSPGQQRTASPPVRGLSCSIGLPRISTPATTTATGVQHTNNLITIPAHRHPIRKHKPIFWTDFRTRSDGTTSVTVGGHSATASSTDCGVRTTFLVVTKRLTTDTGFRGRANQFPGRQSIAATRIE